MKIQASIEKHFNPKESLDKERVLIHLFIDKPDTPPCISFFQGEDTVKVNIPNNTLRKKDFHAFLTALTIASQMK